MRAANTSDLFVELATDPWPPMRGAALRSLARSDPDTFLRALSGLGRDSDWRVRAALAEGLAFVNPEAAPYQLMRLLDGPSPATWAARPETPICIRPGNPYSIANAAREPVEALAIAVR